LLTSAAVSVLALTAPMAAHAAAAAADNGNAVEEVVVTATKTGSTNLQKTALSVDVVGGGDLEAARVISLRDLSSAVAALKISNKNTVVEVTVRGVGGFATNNEQDVGIYADGVYLGRTLTVMQSNFNDLARVEVIKGPQGTTFGRNSVGGALNFVSRGPSDTFQFENTLNVGNYNLVDEAFRVSGPIAKDVISGALAFGYFYHDGYIQNLVPGFSDINAANRYNIRGQLKFQIAPNITNLLRADYIYTKEAFAVNSTLYLPTNDPRFLSCNSSTLVCTYNGYESPIANSKIGDYHYYANVGNPMQRQQDYGINDLLTWEINDQFTLSNLVAYRTSKSYGWTPGNGTEYALGGTQATYRQQQFSNEVNLINKSGKLSGVVGLYYWRDWTRMVGDSLGNLKAPPARTSNGSESYQDTRFPTTSYSVFFNQSYHITPELAVTVGARYTKEHKELDTFNTSYQWIGGLPAGWADATNPIANPQGIGQRGATSPSTIVRNSDGSINQALTVSFPFILGWDGSGPPRLEQDYSDFSPKLGVEWQATEDVFLYASVARGFKGGGFNFQARNAYGVEYDPETIISYELGVKSEFFDKRLRANLALFRNDWKDLQVTQNIVLPGNPLPIGTSSNAAAARITGLDGDFTAYPGDGFKFTMGFTWLPDAEYLDYTGGQAANFIKNLLIQAKDPRENAGLNTYDASGNRIIKAPELSVVLTAEKKFDLGNGAVISLNGDMNYTSPTEFDISNHPIARNEALTLYNASVSFTSPSGRYEAGLWGRNLADKNYANSLIPGNVPQVVSGNPRTFGVRLNYRY
jgi:iron complex outermembrane receptor protein